ncbi:MAG: class I mannose-6-phosphate isomerase [Pirellula sp.]|jgi:mannose-6-phosphate isomerase|nr:class I mannose-6-phosphate isomerase [Pirellula sp.]
MIIPDHPLRFQPIFRSYIWGGKRLATELGKTTPDDGIWAESWEIVDHREAESVVCEVEFEGKSIRQLISDFPEEMTGHPSPTERLPLLLKYLDCDRVLSVQVHPDDSYGATMPIPDRGKTEAWYVIEAAPGAVLYAGLKQGVNRTELARAIAAGETESCLHILYPKAGDCVFIPAGTVHALGAGLLVAEMQQSSDCTFRLFDWNRVDKDGKSRELHIEQAMEVIDFERGPRSFCTRTELGSSGWSRLVECDKFCLDEAVGPKSVQIAGGRFAILTVPKGGGRLRSGNHNWKLERGESLFIPAACSELTLELDSDSVALLAR